MSHGTAFTPTTEQRAALDAFDRSVSLSAGAGCGKTSVLTERFLSYVDPRVLAPQAELTDLVAITFTDPAAREMRQRIRKRCWERLVAAHDPEEAAAWQRLLRGLDAARISTIHSFCSNLLRSHSVEAALDPQFEQLESGAADLLRMQSVDDALREHLIRREDATLDLATHFGLTQLRQHLSHLTGRHSPASFALWLNRPVDQLTDCWQQYYEDDLAPRLKQELLDDPAWKNLQKIVDEQIPATEKLARHFDALRELFEQVAESAPLATPLNSILDLARVQGKCTAKDWNDSDAFEAYKQTCTKVRDYVSKKTLLGRFTLNPATALAAERGQALLAITHEIAERHLAHKRAHNLMEFDDLLADAHALLTSPDHQAVRDELANGTRLLMVDEFQDTDPLQVEIIKAFCGETWQQEKLFVVGDFKQSIYGFRGAEPTVSSELRAELPAASRLSLTTNFRSQPAVIDFVNATFHDAFVEEYEPLVAARSQTSPLPAIEFLWSPVEGTHAKADRPTEARWLVRRLVQLLNSEEHLVGDPTAKGGTRPLRYGDIAILMRTLSDAPIYEDALREHGLPYYLAGGHAFYAQQEIYDVLNLLRAVESPADELSLAGALRSPLFALPDESLYWLVKHHGSLNAGLLAASAYRQAPEELSPEDTSQVQRAAGIVSQLRQTKDELLVAELLLSAIELTGFDAALLCEFLGERKWANVQKLVEQARTLDRTSPGDLSGFISQLAEFVVQTPREASAATQADAEVIRIMTIHHSKGLEFPLVVLPDLERQAPSRNSAPVFHPELGMLVGDKPTSGKESDKSLVGHDLYQSGHMLSEKAERMRVFYVACTRAADYLLLSSGVKNLAKPTSDAVRWLATRIDLTTGEFHGELPTGYDAPEVRVTLEEPDLDATLLKKASRADLAKHLAAAERAAEQANAQGKQSAEPADSSADSADPIVLPNPPQRRFSFSKLSGRLRRAADQVTDTARPESLADEGEIARVSSADALASARSGAAARGLGLLVHAVLERTDFCDPSSRQAASLLSLCDFLAPTYLGSDNLEEREQAKEMLTQFATSPRAADLATARTIQHEVEFLLPWPDAQSGANEAPYLQGYLDCLYQARDGRWHVLDYKTNQVAGNLDDVAAQYELQMFVYRQACEEALGEPLAEATLYFLRPGQEQSFHWDEAATERYRQALTAAMRREAD